MKIEKIQEKRKMRFFLQLSTGSTIKKPRTFLLARIFKKKNSERPKITSREFFAFFR